VFYFTLYKKPNGHFLSLSFVTTTIAPGLIWSLHTSLHCWKFNPRTYSIKLFPTYSLGQI